MNTLLDFIRTKKPDNYEDQKQKFESIETTEDIEQIINEVSGVSDSSTLPIDVPPIEPPLNPPILERQTAMIIEDNKTIPKLKKPISEKKRAALEKARLARSEKAKIRRMRENEEKADKERTNRLQKEAMMLDRLQPMIDDAINRSLNAQKVKESSTQRHPTITRRQSKKVEIIADNTENNKIIEEEARLAILRQAMGF